MRRNIGPAAAGPAATALGKLLYSSSTWWVIVAQYKDFKKSQRVETIVNNSAIDSHIFLLRHSPFLVYITFK